jgi:predicted negative regulator of RcsB-dependent stress response
VGGTTVGGLSGITYDASTQRYYSISDDRGSVGPSPRIYDISIDLSDGALNNGDVTFNGVLQLRRADGTGFPNNSTDPEGIAIAPNGDFYISSEGDNNPANIQQPFVNRFARTTGVQNQALPVPSKFQSSTSPTLGIRNNLAFESVTITPNGQSLFTATENALKQDGPAATVANGTDCRILRFDLTSGSAAEEFVYRTEPVAEAPIPGQFATNGLVEMLALDDTTFLALERSFSVGAPGAGGTGNIIKLFEVSLAGATDVSAFESLSLAGAYTAASKSLLLDLSTLGIALDNIEGITFGPMLPNGQRRIQLSALKEGDAAASGGLVASQARRLSEAAAFANRGNIADAGPEFAAVMDETVDTRLLFVVFQFFMRTGDLERAEVLVRRRLAILESGGEPAALSRACTNLGIVLLARKRHDEARLHLERAVRLDRQSGDNASLARDLGNLANYYEEVNQLEEAVRLNHQSLSPASSLGLEEVAASRLANLGDIARTRGELDTARLLWTQAEEIFARLGIHLHSSALRVKLSTLGAPG